MTRITPIFAGILWFLFASCGDEASRQADAPNVAPVMPSGVAQENEVLGTIEATVDGEARTWYVLEATLNGERQAGAVWFVAEGEENATAAVTGYDSPDVPFETFVVDPDAYAIDYGDYDGSLLTLTFAFRPGGSDALRFSLPRDAGASLVYVADVSSGVTVDQMYGLDEGEMTVTQIEADRAAPGRFAGTFGGTLIKLDQSASMALTGGRFEVSQARYQDDPGGN